MAQRRRRAAEMSITRARSPYLLIARAAFGGHSNGIALIAGGFAPARGLPQTRRVGVSVKEPRERDETAAASWWTALDDEILGTLEHGRAATPAEIGERLGISERAAVSCLAMLAAEGRVRICLVEIGARPDR